MLYNLQALFWLLSIMKKNLLCIGICFILTACAGNKTQPQVTIENIEKTPVLNQIITSQIQQKPFTAYAGCEVVKKSLENLEFYAQDCTVKWKKISIMPNETLPGFYVSIGNGNWEYVPQEMAVQIFDIGEYSDRAAWIEKLLWFLKEKGMLQNEKCNFIKDIGKSSDQRKVFQLVSEAKTQWDCWEYSSQGSDTYEKYFILMDNDKKIVFLNQRKSKNLIDEFSVQFKK